MKSIRNLLLLLVASLLVARCHKENDSLGCAGAGPIQYPGGVTPDPNLNVSVYPYLFEVGSTWKYYDSVSTHLDTLFVASVTHEEGEFSACEAYPDIHTIKLSGFVDLYNLTLFMTSVKFSKHISVQPYADPQTINMLNSANHFELLDSLPTPAQTFHNVMKTGPFNYTASDSIAYDEYYYFVESVGLVRKERYNSGVLVSDIVLVDYDVVF